jgi:hypothetical protein
MANETSIPRPFLFASQERFPIFAVMRGLDRRTHTPNVIRGLDPRTHLSSQDSAPGEACCASPKRGDPRVKPADDVEGGEAPPHASWCPHATWCAAPPPDVMRGLDPRAHLHKSGQTRRANARHGFVTRDLAAAFDLLHSGGIVRPMRFRHQTGSYGGTNAGIA